jgi:hypothetical protein
MWCGLLLFASALRFFFVFFLAPVGGSKGGEGDTCSEPGFARPAAEPLDAVDVVRSRGGGGELPAATEAAAAAAAAFLRAAFLADEVSFLGCSSTAAGARALESSTGAVAALASPPFFLTSAARPRQTFFSFFWPASLPEPLAEWASVMPPYDEARGGRVDGSVTSTTSGPAALGKSTLDVGARRSRKRSARSVRVTLAAVTEARLVRSRVSSSAVGQVAVPTRFMDAPSLSAVNVKAKFSSHAGTGLRAARLTPLVQSASSRTTA